MMFGKTFSNLLAMAFEPILTSTLISEIGRVFDYFVVIEIAFTDNQVQITETISRLDSEKVS